jgi:hypothetical protein
VSARHRAGGAAVLLAALALAPAGCGKPPTQIVLRISTDIDQGPEAELAVVRVRVKEASGNGNWDFDTKFYPGGRDPLLPATLAINPSEGTTSGHVVIEISPYGPAPDALAHFIYNAEADFTPGHITVLDVTLPARCIDERNQIMCDLTTQTCGPDSAPCIPIQHTDLPLADDL